MADGERRERSFSVAFGEVTANDGDVVHLRGIPHAAHHFARHLLRAYHGVDDAEWNATHRGDIVDIRQYRREARAVGICADEGGRNRLPTSDDVLTSYLDDRAVVAGPVNGVGRLDELTSRGDGLFAGEPVVSSDGDHDGIKERVGNIC